MVYGLAAHLSAAVAGLHDTSQKSNACPVVAMCMHTHMAHKVSIVGLQ
jgi:hypothetical protein